MATMKAVHIVGYHRDLEMTEISKPEITGPFDLVVRIGGAGLTPDHATARAARRLRPADRCVVIGAGGLGHIGIPTIDIISTGTNLIGNLIGSYDDLTELTVLAARGLVKLHTATYALDDFQTAIDDLNAGRVRGRAILVP